MQQTVKFPTRTILHPHIDVITIRYVQDLPKNFCNRIQEKSPYKEILLVWLMLIMIIFWMKLSVVKKLSLRGMWVETVTRNCTDDNNHNAILYVNIIWIFICFYVLSLLIDSVMFILLKDEMVPECIKHHKIWIEKVQLFLHQRKESI